MPVPGSSASGLTPDTRRILAEIDGLPADEGEAFGLVRIQGLTHAVAAQVLDVSTKTVQRRLEWRSGAVGGAAQGSPAGRRAAGGDLGRSDRVPPATLVALG